MLVRHLFPFAALLAAALLGAHAVAAPQLLLLNGAVFTADPTRPQAEAVAVEDGRISAVGSSDALRPMAGPGTRVIDLRGRRVTPGLVEAHVHLGWNLPSPPLSLPGPPFPGPSAAQVLAAVEAAAKADPQGWVSAWIGPRVANDPRNWRAALDAVSPDTPVLLRAFWGHGTIVNSAALKRLAITEDVPDPLGGWWGRDADGRLDGRAYETAENLEQRAAPPDPAALTLEFREAGQRYARWGVTSIHLMNSGLSLQTALQALAAAGTPQKWTIYSWAGPVSRIADAWATLDNAPRTLPPRVRIEGPKWLLDGTGIEQNALKRTPYAGRGDWRGRANYSEAQLREILQIALQRPQQLALHTVGDAQTDALFALMESLAPASVWRDKRVRIEHGDGIRPDTLARAARLGVVVIQNPTHFPPSPAPAQSLLASLRGAGVPLALGSDGGVDEANPYLNLMLATSYAARPDEALTRAQALTAYTAGGAFAARDEARQGRIAPGMAADIAVLSQDVLTIPAAALPATRSLLTLVNGEIVYEERGALPNAATP